MNLLWLLLSSLIGFSGTMSISEKQIWEETQYREAQRSVSKLKTQHLIFGLPLIEPKIFIDAVEDMVLEDPSDKQANLALKLLVAVNLNFEERLRIEILKIKTKQIRKFSNSFSLEVITHLKQPVVEPKVIYLIAANQKLLKSTGHRLIVLIAKKHMEFYDVIEDEADKEIISDAAVYDLFQSKPDLKKYMGGEYEAGFMLYVFCRTNRIYPCLMLLRDKTGAPVRNDDGSLWAHSGLASSARGLPSYVRNGNTPTGVFTIDSVMPTADQQLMFGKFRRLIVNFIPTSEDELLLKTLLPDSAEDEPFWKEAVVARDIGRNNLRIHGTGRINKDPIAPYYPFTRTAGCVSQRENTYDGVTYKDQRILLDQLMKTMGYTPQFSNEPKIKGIMYIIDIDDKNEKVTLQDLVLRGIN